MENIIKDKLKDKEHLLGQMDKNIQVIGNKVWWMDKENYI